MNGIDKVTSVGVKIKNHNGGWSVLKGSKKKIDSFQKLLIPS